MRSIDRALSLGKERFSISVIFLVHGLVVASWVSRIPALQAALGLSPAVLGTVLLSASAGALVAMPLTGGLVHRFGSRRLVILTTIFFCLTLTLLARPGSAAGLAFSLFIFGAAAGGMDVSMNVQAAEFERKKAKPVMSSFHGLFSVGGMLGAAIGGAVAQRGVGPGTHFALASLAFGVLGSSVLPWLSPGSSRSESTLALRFDRRILVLGAIGFCILIGEGAMADWTAVYLHNSLGTSAGLAALGYSVFSACMAGGRFLGDWLNQVLGPVRLVRAGSLLAAFGMAAATMVEHVPVTLVGFGLVGAGFSTIIHHLRGRRKCEGGASRGRRGGGDDDGLLGVSSRSAAHRVDGAIDQPANSARFRNPVEPDRGFFGERGKALELTIDD